MHSAWEVPRISSASLDYGILPAKMVKIWATDQANLSDCYQTGRVPAVSADEAGRIRKAAMVRRIEDALTTRSNLSPDEIKYRLDEIEEHLEDPGLLRNFEYFDVPSSDFMLQFYFAVWDRRIAEVMGYLHNYGKDLRGISRKVPQNDVWYQMSFFEGMNINERKKSRDIVEFIRTHHIERATSFGGGNIPERLHGLPSCVPLTVFDDGPVSPLEELFPDLSSRRMVNYFHEPLSQAPLHNELLGTQQLVWMSGVSMYLDEVHHHQMAGAILCAVALLEIGGYMKYDYLLWNESMRRVIKTQNWPYDPNHPMVIFDSADAAIEEGRATVATVNQRLGGKIYMEVLDQQVTFTEPWGCTSVRFTLRKHLG